MSARRLFERFLQRMPARITRVCYDVLRDADLKALAQSGDARPLALVGTHDLSLSGAPRVALELVHSLGNLGYRVIVVTMRSGPMLEEFEQAGATVLTDRFPVADSAYLQTLARSAEIAIANTVVCAPLVRAWAVDLPVIWYLHETSLLEEFLGRKPVRSAFKEAGEIWAGSELSASFARTVRPDTRVLPYGIEPLEAPETRASVGHLTIAVFGSIERRKGQDLAVAAFGALSPDEQKAIRLQLFGRILEPDFAKQVLASAAAFPQIIFGGELDTAGYRQAVANVDSVLVSSREDTLPLVSIDALSAGRLLLLTLSVGTSAWLEDGRDALIEPAADTAGMVRLFRRALQAQPRLGEIGAAARETFAKCFATEGFRRTFNERIKAVRIERR